MTVDASSPDLTVVIAAFDEEETVEAVLRELCETLGDSIHFEVLVVDDGSRDRTYEIVRGLCDELPKLRLVGHPRNLGKSAAILTAAHEARGRWVLTMDADGQNDPSDFLHLWEAALEVPAGMPTIICGRRSHRADTRFKWLSSKIANAVRRSLLNDETPDTGCGIKLFPRQAFLELPQFHNIHRFLPCLFLRQGGKTLSLTVNDRPRQGGVSKFGFSNRFFTGIVDLLGVMWMVRRSTWAFSEIRETELRR